MRNKRVLMIADADSYLTKSFIKQVYLPAGYAVTLFPIWGDSGANSGFFADNGITVYRDAHRLPVIRHIPRLRMWARIWLNARALCRDGSFDIVQNHYLSQRDLALGCLVKKRCGARWLCDFWGSDLLRAPKRELKGMKPLLKQCDAIAVNNASHKDMVGELFGEDARRKTRLLLLGQSSYEATDRVAAENDRRACKAHFGIDPDKTVICLGYNASPAHRHIEMLDALSRAQCMKNAAVVLQMTYGSPDADYPARVYAHAKELGLDALLLTDFMDETESAYLRLSADIFIHCIATDAFCASLREYIYAGAAVLKGAWLSYPALDDMGIALDEFASPDALPALVDRAASGGVEPTPLEKRKELEAHYSWDSVRDKWTALLEGEPPR